MNIRCALLAAATLAFLVAFEISSATAGGFLADTFIRTLPLPSDAANGFHARPTYPDDNRPEFGIIGRRGCVVRDVEELARSRELNRDLIRRLGIVID